MTKQVSIEIRAALGQAFNKAFTTADSQLGTLKKSISELNSQAAKVKALSDLRQKFSDLAKETAKYETEISSLSATLKAAEGEQSRHKAAVKSAADALSKSSQAAEAAGAAHAPARARLALLNLEFDQSETKTTEQKVALKAATIAVSESNLSWIKARASMREASEALGSHKTLLQAATTRVHEHQKALDKARRSHDSGAAAVKAAKDKLSGYEQELKKAGIDVDKLADAERRLGVQLRKNQSAYDDTRTSRQLALRGRELRSSAISDFYDLTASSLAFGTPIKIAGDFEQAIAKVGATTNATESEIARLAKTARELGRDTVFSATDAANAQSYLGQAGFNPREIEAALPATLKLAEAGETDLAETADMASNMLRGFNLDASEMTRVADVMTATFVGSNATLRGLAETMKYVAPIASALGASIEEVSASSGILGNVGIQESMAGTALRSLYTRLADPPAEAQKALDEMGVKTRDSKGNMRPTQDVFGDMARGLDRFGSGKRLELLKGVGGQEALAGTVEIVKAKRSGVLDLEIKKLELAPAFRTAVDELKNLAPGQLKALSDQFGISIQQGMSKAQIASELPKIFAGVKGQEFENRFRQVFPQKLKKREELPAELNLSSPEARKELKRLNVPETGYFGEKRSNEEITGDVFKALETAPVMERFKSMSILFSKATDGLRRLALEASNGQKGFSELTGQLEKTNSASEVSAKLNKTTWGALKNVASSLEESAIAIGSIFLPKLAELLKGLSPIIQSFALWVSEHENITAMLGYLAAAIIANKVLLIGFKLSVSSLAGVINFATLIKRGWIATMSIGGTVLKTLSSGAGSAIKYIWNLGRSIQFVALAQKAWNLAMRISPLGLAVTAALALGAAAVYAYRNWDSVKVKLNGVFEKIAPVVKTLWDAIRPFVELTPLGLVVANWDKVIEYFKKFAATVKPYFEMVAGIFSSDKKELKLTDGRASSVKDLLKDAPELPRNVSQPISGATNNTQTQVVNQKIDFHMKNDDAAAKKSAQIISGEVRSPFTTRVQRSNFDPVGAL